MSGVGRAGVASGPVTFGESERCVDAGYCTPPASPEPNSPQRVWGTDSSKDLPTNRVNWHQAKNFCGWLGKRLPTDEEWDYAARRGASENPWGPSVWEFTGSRCCPQPESPCNSCALDDACEYRCDACPDDTGYWVLRGAGFSDLPDDFKNRLQWRGLAENEGYAEHVGFRCAKTDVVVLPCARRRVAPQRVSSTGHCSVSA